MPPKVAVSYRVFSKKEGQPSTKAGGRAAFSCGRTAFDWWACRRVYPWRACRARACGRTASSLPVFAMPVSGRSVFHPGGYRSRVSATDAFPIGALVPREGLRLLAWEKKACGPLISARRAFPTGACFQGDLPQRAFARRVFPIRVSGRLGDRPRAEARMVCCLPTSATQAFLKAERPRPTGILSWTLGNGQFDGHPFVP